MLWLFFALYPVKTDLAIFENPWLAPFATPPVKPRAAPVTPPLLNPLTAPVTPVTAAFARPPTIPVIHANGPLTIQSQQQQQQQQ